MFEVKFMGEVKYKFETLGELDIWFTNTKEKFHKEQVEFLSSHFSREEALERCEWILDADIDGDLDCLDGGSGDFEIIEYIELGDLLEWNDIEYSKENCTYYLDGGATIISNRPVPKYEFDSITIYRDGVVDVEELGKEIGYELESDCEVRL